MNARSNATKKPSAAEDLPLDAEAEARQLATSREEVIRKTRDMIPPPTHPGKPGVTPPPVPGKKAQSTPPPIPEAAKKPKLSVVAEAKNIVSRPMILDGQGADNLKESMQSFELASGDHLAAATDKGINYKPHNEDRVVVIPGLNSFAVLDGMGGMGSGDRAAEIIAEEIYKSPDNLNIAISEAQTRMKQEKILSGGACFLFVRIIKDKKGNKYLDIYQAGDVRGTLYDEEGNVKFRTKDDSAVQLLHEVNTNPKAKEVLATAGIAPIAISKDEMTYHPTRNIVFNAITATKKDIKKYNPVPVKDGDTFLGATDGIGDNLTDEEAGKEIASVSAEEGMENLSDITDLRMMDQNNIIKTTNERGGRKNYGIYTDGFKSTPKSDNRGGAILKFRKNVS